MQTLEGLSNGNLGKKFQKQEDGKWYWVKMGKPFGKGFTDKEIENDLNNGHLKII